MSDELLESEVPLADRNDNTNPSTSQNNENNTTIPLKNLTGGESESKKDKNIPESKLNFDADQYKKLNACETWRQFNKGAAVLFSDPKKYFQLEERGTTVGIELKGGFATFLTMSYILVVNPGILAVQPELGLTKNAVLTATAMSAAICNIMMGLFTNFPMAVAAGMGLNAYIAYSVILASGVTWEAAMGLVVWDGIFILILVLIGLREAVLDAIPEDLKRAISVGIGMFIALIGAVDARLVVVPEGTINAIAFFNSTDVLPPVGASSFQVKEVIVCFFGVFITATMLNRRWPGAVIIGIIASTILAAILGLVEVPSFEAPDFHLAFKADLSAPFKPGGGILWAHLFSFTMVDFFDTLGTMTATSSKAKLTSPSGRIPNSTPILIMDSLSALIGGLFGASSNTAYIECCTGICEGARTGLHSIFVGLFFLIAVGLAPIVSFFPQCATAPALLLIGFMMCDQITEINFGVDHYETGIPAFLTIIFIPMTYSIAHGIGYGFVTYTIIMVGSGKGKTLAKTTSGTIIMYGCSLVFVLFFIFADDLGKS